MNIHGKLRWTFIMWIKFHKSKNRFCRNWQILMCLSKFWSFEWFGMNKVQNDIWMNHRREYKGNIIHGNGNTRKIYTGRSVFPLVCRRLNSKSLQKGDFRVFSGWFTTILTTKRKDRIEGDLVFSWFWLVVSDYSVCQTKANGTLGNAFTDPQTNKGIKKVMFLNLNICLINNA